ncbi:MAG: hypothetical protein A2X61_07085 [Ignavibacteria bacterium GWB2_35_12]|nr:MAG: hypothetical protein A2X61_07085 [Ignavibacteria bacterium GWB2_35_12]OGU88686.1 MAG: hypothetical protein A2220_00525 [Ignavibacteria bacterium RIFOXYA2_FULL_35_10]OGV23258.1 MAG: hypothetical protein A2475_13470 [Ignavibacteria bacterium RIFOXYC2_FULL_35_21]
MKKIKVLLILLTFSGIAVLTSCKSSPPPLDKDDIMPYQKRADIVITNEDYQKTNKDINRLTKKFEGFIKNSSFNTDVKSQSNAEYEIHVPYTFFNNFKENFDNTFKPDIVEETVSDEESLTKLYYSNLAKIDEKTAALQSLKESYAVAKDVNDRIVMKYEIDKLSTEVNEHQQKRLSLLESMNYSTVRVVWKQKAEDKDLLPAGVPGLPPPPRQIVLKNYGQIENFKVNEPVAISMEDLNPEETNIISNIDMDDGNVEMRVTKNDEKETVVLDKKCQIVIVGLGPLPEIVRGDAIKREQIVITPIIDDECNIIGNEIRAGTIESGCIEGRKNYYRLLNCVRHGKPVVIKKKRVARTQQSVQQQRHQRPLWEQREEENSIFMFPLD